MTNAANTGFGQNKEYSPEFPFLRVDQFKKSSS